MAAFSGYLELLKGVLFPFAVSFLLSSEESFFVSFFFGEGFHGSLHRIQMGGVRSMELKKGFRPSVVGQERSSLAGPESMSASTLLKFQRRGSLGEVISLEPSL